MKYLELFENFKGELILENKLTNLFNNFDLEKIKTLLKEKLDIDGNTPKMDIAKKLLKYYYKLELKMLKYELGGLLGGFIFYFLSIVLDLAGVEPFATKSPNAPTMPHFLLWGAGVLLGIYKVYKMNNKK